MPPLDLARVALSVLGYSSRDVETRTGKVRFIESARDGSLPTIVLLHGLGARGADYLPLLQRVRKHARVIAPDMPGHGASETPRDFDIAKCIDGMCEALDQVIDDRAIVFGNSLGGYTALRFALASPHRVRGLFLASPAGGPSTPEEKEAWLSVLRVESHADAVRFMETVLHAPGPLKHVLAWNVRRRFGTPALHALFDDADNAIPFTPEELAKVTAPIHLLWGQSERLLPPSHFAFFKRNLPNATIERPEGQGHSPPLDDVNDVARRLLHFARHA